MHTNLSNLPFSLLFRTVIWVFFLVLTWHRELFAGFHSSQRGVATED